MRETASTFFPLSLSLSLPLSSSSVLSLLLPPFSECIAAAAAPLALYFTQLQTVFFCKEEETPHPEKRNGNATKRKGVQFDGEDGEGKQAK